jgi:hypothetical protein
LAKNNKKAKSTEVLVFKMENKHKILETENGTGLGNLCRMLIYSDKINEKNQKIYRC